MLPNQSHKPLSTRTRLRARMDSWARKRQGADPDPVIISRRRVYILPTGLGLLYAGMVFIMMIGAMNYANNLALGLTFALGALGLVAMHHCHRTLVGVKVASGATEPVFAGQTARFRVRLENPSSVARYELAVSNHFAHSTPCPLSGGGYQTVEVQLPAEHRGRLLLNRFELSCRHPFGLFRAWAILHMDIPCIVYPRLSSPGDAPPPMATDVGSAQDARRGDDDFAGLRAFAAGDSPRHVAWKAYARGQGLHVKQYAGTAVVSYILDWDSLQGLDVEARLSRLARWIEDAHSSGRAYGLKIPGTKIPPNLGTAHRQRCLTALALFDEHASRS